MKSETTQRVEILKYQNYYSPRLLANFHTLQTSLKDVDNHRHTSSTFETRYSYLNSES